MVSQKYHRPPSPRKYRLDALGSHDDTFRVLLLPREMTRFHLSAPVRTRGQLRPPHGRTQWLFIIEGDSASGNAELGRKFLFKYVGGGGDGLGNPWFRCLSILTLTGVIRNEARAKKAYSEDDFRNLMSYIDRRGNRETIARVLEYDKIVIMTDPDADGAHIRGLVLLAITTRHPGLLHHPGFLYTLRVPRFIEQDGGLPHKGLGSLSENAVLRVFLHFERHLEEYVSNTNTNTNTKYTCDTCQTRNKLLAQWVHLRNHAAGHSRPGTAHLTA
jgi:hypothetical protein